MGIGVLCTCERTLKVWYRWRLQWWRAPASCTHVSACHWQLVTARPLQSLTCFDTWPKIITELVCSWSDCVSPGTRQYVIKSSGVCCTQPLHKVSWNQRWQLAIQFGLESLFVIAVVVVFTSGWEGLAALIHQSPVTFPFPPNCFIFYQAWCSVEDPPDMETINQCISGCVEWDCFPDI